jgi:hypothetical protein
MAVPLKVKIKDVNGNCCCGMGACVMFCSTRGGTATICGTVEFLNIPSIPPRAYRTATHTGSPFVCVYFRTDCLDPSGPGTLDSYDYDASTPYLYDKDTCTHNAPKYTHYVQTGSGLSCNYSASGTPVLEDITPPPPGPATSTDPHGVIHRSLTSYAATYDNSLCVPTGGFFVTLSGSETWDLTDEDTELDAINRIPGITVWGDYVSCSSTPQCCRTAWQSRGAGEFSFEYLEARLLCRISNLPHNTAVTVKVDTLRRPYGSGTYVDYQTLENGGTSDNTGFLEVDFGTMNNTQGYETIASNCRVSLAS